MRRRGTGTLPFASRRGASCRLRARGRTCPCLRCSHASSRAYALSPSFSQFEFAYAQIVLVPAESAQDFAYADARSWPCAPCAPHEPLSTGHNPHLTFRKPTGILQSVLCTLAKKKKVKEPLPALVGISCNHCVSSALFFPFHPQRDTHAWLSSSHTFLSRR